MRSKAVLIMILVLTIGLLISCQNNKNQTGNPQNEIDKNLTQRTSKQQHAVNDNYKVTFIELGSKNCIPCKKMEPIMEAIEKKYPEQVEVVFYDVRTREGKPYAKKYNIRVIPTQVFLDSEGNEFGRHEGFFPQKEIEKILEQKGVE